MQNALILTLFILKLIGNARIPSYLAWSFVRDRLDYFSEMRHRLKSEAVAYLFHGKVGKAEQGHGALRLYLVFYLYRRGVRIAFKERIKPRFADAQMPCKFGNTK